MKHRKLGNTGLIVSEVALGTMQFGGKMNMGNLGQEDTTRMVKLALDRGINFIDTADVYSLGESETLVGNALKGVRREIVLATKVRLPMSDNLNRSGASRVNIMREVEDSLQRLQTDYIDLYQVHGWDSNTPLEETLRTLDDVVRQGKVRYIGLSNFMSWQAATAIMQQDCLGLEKFVTAQMYYSLVGRGLEYEFQSFAEYHNIGILVWSPLAGGFLTGKYDRDNPAPAGTRFAEAGSFVPFGQSQLGACARHDDLAGQVPRRDLQPDQGFESQRRLHAGAAALAHGGRSSGRLGLASRQGAHARAGDTSGVWRADSGVD